MEKKYMENELVRLRALEPEDIDILYKWENDSSIWHMSNTRTPFSRFTLEEFIESSRKDIYETKQQRFIIENSKKIPVGAIDLYDFDPYHLRAGIGILIHDCKYRNHGYACDALEALTNYALTSLGLKQLYVNIAADNIPSIRLFKKAGFVQTGIKKSWLKTTSGWKDEILLQRILA